MKTYRYSGHSRSDPATYRPAGELDAWLKRDPINIFAERLVGESILAAGGLDQLKTEVRDAVERATAEVLESSGPDLGELLSHVGAHSAGGDQRWNFWSR
jgi:pyruvate dehydrogenase E1 component alpha subunit